MIYERDLAKGDSEHGQLRRHLRRYAANIFDDGDQLVAWLMHQSILSLQFTPAAALFGNDDRQDKIKHADKSGIRRSLHSIICDPVVLDLDSIRPSTGERADAATTVSVDIQEHPTRTSSGETDDDGK